MENELLSKFCCNFELKVKGPKNDLANSSSLILKNEEKNVENGGDKVISDLSNF